MRSYTNIVGVTYTERFEGTISRVIFQLSSSLSSVSLQVQATPSKSMEVWRMYFGLLPHIGFFLVIHTSFFQMSTTLGQLQGSHIARPTMMTATTTCCTLSLSSCAVPLALPSLILCDGCCPQLLSLLPQTHDS